MGNIGLFRKFPGKKWVFSAGKVAIFPKKKPTAIDVSRRRGHDHCCFTFQFFFSKVMTQNVSGKIVLDGPYYLLPRSI